MSRLVKAIEHEQRLEDIRNKLKNSEHTSQDDALFLLEEIDRLVEVCNENGRRLTNVRFELEDRDHLASILLNMKPNPDPYRLPDRLVDILLNKKPK